MAVKEAASDFPIARFGCASPGCAKKGMVEAGISTSPLRKPSTAKGKWVKNSH